MTIALITIAVITGIGAIAAGIWFWRKKKASRSQSPQQTKAPTRETASTPAPTKQAEQPETERAEQPETEKDNEEFAPSGRKSVFQGKEKPCDKLFGSIGTTLLQPDKKIKLEEIWWANKEEKKEKEGWYNFNIAHFLSSMAFDDHDWMILTNIKTPDPKLYGDRSLKMFKLLRKFKNENKDKTLSFDKLYDKGVKNIKKDIIEEVSFSEGKSELTFFTAATIRKSSEGIPSKVCEEEYFPADIKEGVKNYLEKEEEKGKVLKQEVEQEEEVEQEVEVAQEEEVEEDEDEGVGEGEDKGIPVAPPEIPDAPAEGELDAEGPSKTESINFENSSSRCSPGQINDIVEGMQALRGKGELAWPLFSVWDCNSFHTSGYLMGKYAFDCAESPQDKTLIVVNIDQHSDAGSSSQKYVSSDRWGTPLIKQYGKGVYVSLSCAGMKEDDIACESHVWYKDEEKGIQYIKVETPRKRNFLDAKKQKATTESWILKKHLDGLVGGEKKNAEEAMTKHWKALLGLIEPEESEEPKHFDYVFLTIDRDCMKNNFTQWGDGKSILENYKHVNNVAGAVLETLTKNGAKLVGFDVTGLPEDGEYVASEPCCIDRTTMDKLGDKADIDKHAEAVKEIKESKQEEVKKVKDELAAYYNTFKKFLPEDE